MIGNLDTSLTIVAAELFGPSVFYNPKMARISGRDKIANFATGWLGVLPV